MADRTLRRQLSELMSSGRDLDEADVVRWRALIAATGAVQWIEEMIADRLRRAPDWIDAGRLGDLGAFGAAATWRRSARSGRHDARLPS